MNKKIAQEIGYSVLSVEKDAELLDNYKNLIQKDKFIK